MPLRRRRVFHKPFGPLGDPERSGIFPRDAPDLHNAERARHAVHTTMIPQKSALTTRNSHRVLPSTPQTSKKKSPSWNSTSSTAVRTIRASTRRRPSPSIGKRASWQGRARRRLDVCFFRDVVQTVGHTYCCTGLYIMHSTHIR